MNYLRRLSRVELVLLLVAYALLWATVDSWYHWHVTAADPVPAAMVQLTTQSIGTDGLFKHQNALRTATQVAPLKQVATLDKVAAAKCTDMVTQKYWGQKDPKGVESWHFLKDANITYKQAANNLAAGYRHTNTLVRAWDKDAGIKSSVLNPAYTQTGFAICKTTDAKTGKPALYVVQYLTN